MIGFGARTVQSPDDDQGVINGSATWIRVDASAVSALQPFGTLPFVVIGVKQGKLQIVNHNSQAKTEQDRVKPMPIEKWSTLELVTLSKAIDIAKSNRCGFPRRGERHLCMPSKWMAFEPWKYMHYWQGNTKLLRHHVFFQLIRQIPSSGVKEPRVSRNYADLQWETRTITYTKQKTQLGKNKVVPMIH